MIEQISPVITIDGPSGVGKGTLCKFISRSLGWPFLDSGLIYRCLALFALKYKLDISSEDEILSIASDFGMESIKKNFEKYDFLFKKK